MADREKPRRHQTSTERDVQGLAARRERDAAVPAVVERDITGRYEGEELHRHRAKRPTQDRIQRLEDKHDAVAKDVHEMRGEVGAILRLAGEEADARRAREAAEAVEREKARSHIVPIIKAVGVALALIAAALIGRG